MSKTVAITGAGGFIGKRLAREMAQQGWNVYAITSHPENLPENPRVTAIDCNWTTEGIKEVVARAKNASLWVHAAARVDFSDGELLALYRDNTLTTECQAYNIKSLDVETRLVYLSTVSVYGSGQEKSTDIEPQPGNHYGLSKLLGERLCQAHMGECCLILRLAGVWGNEEKPKLFINRCLRQARAGGQITIAGNGKTKRNYLWVGDIPKIISLAYGGKWHGIRIAAGHKPLSIYKMADAIGKRYKVPVLLKDRDDTQTEPDIVVGGSPGLPATDYNTALDIEIGVEG